MSSFYQFGFSFKTVEIQMSVAVQDLMSIQLLKVTTIRNFGFHPDELPVEIINVRLDIADLNMIPI